MRLSVVLILSLALTGCIGYQNVKTYERVNDEVVLTKRVEAYILGTSGQKISDKDITIEKNDAADKAVTLLQTSLSTAKDIAMSRVDTFTK